MVIPLAAGRRRRKVALQKHLYFSPFYPHRSEPTGQPSRGCKYRLLVGPQAVVSVSQGSCASLGGSLQGTGSQLGAELPEPPLKLPDKVGLDFTCSPP